MYIFTSLFIFYWFIIINLFFFLSHSSLNLFEYSNSNIEYNNDEQVKTREFWLLCHWFLSLGAADEPLSLLCSLVECEVISCPAAPQFEALREMLVESAWDLNHMFNF